MDTLSARTVELLRHDRMRLVDAADKITKLLVEAGVEDSGNGRRGRHDQPTGRPVGRKCQYDWEEGRRLYEQEDKTINEIADALNCSRSAVKSRKRDFGWVRGGVETESTEEQKAVEVEDTVNGGVVFVECPVCEEETCKDPCSKCRTKLPTALAIRVRSV